MFNMTALTAVIVTDRFTQRFT